MRHGIIAANSIREENGLLFLIATDSQNSRGFNVTYIGTLDDVKIQVSHNLEPKGPATLVTITINAEEKVNGIKSIQKPDGQIVDMDSTTYEVTANGDYVFKIISNIDREAEYVVKVSNIDVSVPVVVYRLTPSGNTSGDVTIHINANHPQGIESIELPDGRMVTGKNTASYKVDKNNTDPGYRFVITDISGKKEELYVPVTNIID